MALDPTQSLNDLHEVPFLDFLILHQIYPRAFLLEVDSHFGRPRRSTHGPTHPPARGQNNGTTQTANQDGSVASHGVASGLDAGQDLDGYKAPGGHGARKLHAGDAMYGSFGGDPGQFANGVQFGGTNFARIEDAGSKRSDRSVGGGGQARRPPRKPLTQYESFLQKYVQYLQQGKLERAELLIRQGQAIFPSPEARKQFMFNSGVYSLAKGKYRKAAQKYIDIYELYGKHVKVRPAARRIEATAPAESEKFAEAGSRSGRGRVAAARFRRAEW